MQREDLRADVSRRMGEVYGRIAAVELALQLMDEAATRARDEAFAEVALHLKHLVEAAALKDPAERRRKAEAVLAQISADIGNEEKLSRRLAEAQADGLRQAIGVFVRQAIARGHRNSQDHRTVNGLITHIAGFDSRGRHQLRPSRLRSLYRRTPSRGRGASVPVSRAAGTGAPSRARHLTQPARAAVPPAGLSPGIRIVELPPAISSVGRPVTNEIARGAALRES